MNNPPKVVSIKVLSKSFHDYAKSKKDKGGVPLSMDSPYSLENLIPVFYGCYCFLWVRAQELS